MKNLLAKDFIEAEPKELSKEERIAEGKKVFQKEPSSAIVLNALLELYHESLDMSFRRRHDEIFLKKNIEPITTSLNKDQEDALFQKIHLLSSKSEAENFFDENSISVVELKKAIESLQKAG